jgi:xylulokinase
MAEELLLGFDIGTYSSKGVLATPDGRVIATAQIEHELYIPRPGWAEHDAETIWWADLCTIVRQLLEGRDPSSIKAIGVSGLGPDLVVLDRETRPLRPAILYGIDTRAEQEISEIEARLGRGPILQRTGAVLTSQAVGPKLRWLAKHEPEVLARACYVTSASGFLVLRLTGAHVLDWYTAGSFNPLFDVRERRWIPEWCDDIVDPSLLPEIVSPLTVVGEVTPAASEQTGLKPGTPVIAGTIDAAAEAVSVGAVTPGDLMLMYGTTLFLILTTESLKLDERFWALPHVFPDRFCLAGGTATGGALTRWFCDSFCQGLQHAECYQTMALEAAQVPPGSGGLILLPYFSGERTPIHDPRARGLLLGLTLEHKRAAVYRSLLEGTALSIRHNLEVLREAGAVARRIIAVGGGTRNEFWLQIMSDVTGLRQEIPEVTVGASYGDAFLAGLAVGLIPDESALMKDWVRIARVIEPNPKNIELYTKLYEIYRGLYPATRAYMHSLAQLSSAAVGASSAQG